MVLLAAGLGVLCALTSLFASMAYVRRRHLLEQVVKDEVCVAPFVWHLPLILRDPGRGGTPPKYLDLPLAPLLVLWVVSAAAWPRAFVVPLRAAPPAALVGPCHSGSPTLHHGNWYSYPSHSLPPRRSEFSASISRDGTGGRRRFPVIKLKEQYPAIMCHCIMDSIYVLSDFYSASRVA